MRRRIVLAWFLGVTLAMAGAGAAGAQADPLPSWNEGAVKDAIVRFVQAVTDRASAQYVAPEARIATFDNDGTLWSEQPMYFQGMFAFGSRSRAHGMGNRARGSTANPTRRSAGAT